MIAVKAGPGRCARGARELLDREGLRPWVDADCPQGIYFQWNGHPHFVQVDEADPGFLLVCVGFRLAERQRQELRLLREAAAVQLRAQVVKVQLGARLEYVAFQCELFLGAEGLTRPLLDRCLAALRSASDDFFGEEREEEAPRARA